MCCFAIRKPALAMIAVASAYATFSNYCVVADNARNSILSSGQAPDSLSGFDVVGDTTFSVRRGFYKEPLSVEVTTKTPGATLIYTLDGTLPNAENGQGVAPENELSTPILRLPVSKTTILRVLAVKSGFEPTNVDTQSYIYPEQVLQQGETGVPFNRAARWGHAGADWEMDPEIVNHSNPEVRPIPEDLLRIATVSLTMDFDEMFGRNGIYIAGQSVERKASIEFMNPDNSVDDPNSADGFHTVGTVQIVGGSSTSRWKSDKLSLRLKFKPDLKYPVFGKDAADRFDTLVLDARLNNVWHYGGGSDPTGQRGRAQYVRDQYVANLHNAMGGHSPHGRHIHLYINGIYWGLHTLHERPDDNFAASYLGGDNNDYDSIKHTPTDVLQGSSSNYNRLHSLANRVLRDESSYKAISDMLDIDDFIAYMLVNYYVGNTDWAHHNWYASFNRVDPDGRWRFHSWDAEKGLHRVQDNLAGKNDSGGPTNLQNDLMRSPEYRLRFADRAYHELRSGTLSPGNAAKLYQNLTDPIDLVMRVESARWGDNQRRQPFTRIDWLTNRDELFGRARNRNAPLFDYFNRRSEIVLQQFKSRGWLPSIEPPTFNRQGGYVPRDFALVIEANAPGTVYFTLDGSDPRNPGEPAPVTSAAQAYSTPVILTEPVLVRARLRSGTEWSPIAEADFRVDMIPARLDNLVVSRIHYHPLESDPSEISAGFENATDFEFLELANITDFSIDLTGLRFIDGIDFSFARSSPIRHLPPRGSTRIVFDETAHAFRFGTEISVAGEFRKETKLSNAGERISLVGVDNQVIAEFSYDDKAPWPNDPDGNGFSLVLKDPASHSNPDLAESWIALAESRIDTQEPKNELIQAWLADQFGINHLDDLEVSGLGADPDLDGIANILEFFHAIDPNVPSAKKNLLHIELLPSAPGTRFGLTFTKRNDIGPSYWALEHGTDLSHWEQIKISDAVSVIQTGDGIETLQIPISISPSERFFRLKVSTDPQ